MGGRSDKKAKHKKKRDERRRELVRTRNASPYRVAGRSGETVACYANKDWKEEGIVVAYILKRVPSGGMVMATFFVDLWCAGLKNAFGWLDASREDFEEQVLHGKVASQVDLVRVDVDFVKRMVAGGLRFAEQNGFRLPPRYERWVAVLGDIGDWRSADLGEFGVNGGLRWVGPLSDLQKRLVGCSIEEFMARKNVEFVTDLDGEEFPEDDEDAEYAEADEAIEEVAADLHERWLNGLRKWCFANNQVPHPRLDEAIGVIVESMLRLPDDAENVKDDNEEACAAMAWDYANRMVDITAGPDAEDLRVAMAQVEGFIQSFPTPEAMAAAIGMDFSDIEED